MGICHPKSHSAESRNFNMVSGLCCAYIYLKVIAASNKRLIDQWLQNWKLKDCWVLSSEYYWQLFQVPKQILHHIKNVNKKKMLFNTILWI